MSTRQMRIIAEPVDFEPELMTEEELQKYGPEKTGLNPLQVLWDNYQQRPGSSVNDEMFLADLGTNQIYSVSLAPDGTNILVYPIRLIQEPDYSSGKLVPPTTEGVPDWGAVQEQYFPGGYFDINDKLIEDAEPVAPKASSNQFWKKVLAKLLKNYSAREYHLELQKNPYKIKYK